MKIAAYFALALALVFTLISPVLVMNAQTGAKPAPAKPTATPTTVAKKHPLDKGDFRVGFPPKVKAKQAMAADDKKVFQEIADALNGLIAMPKDIYLNIDECGEPNAFYDPNNGQITFCYELLEQYEDDFKTIEKDQKKVDGMVEDTLVQTLFHELGHCLIDVWELPATGREEDAVDQLATILMLDDTDEGTLSTINAALQFDIASRNDDPNDLAFWDEHSFSKTRFYDMICLAFGSNPEKHEWMIGPDKLPESRAVRCEEEYQRANRSWMKLLAPYLIS